MASTFTTLGIEKMATGENAGTWGDKTNTNLDIVNTAIAGYVEQSIAGGADTTALTITDGAATATLQNAVIKFTGTISGNQVVTIPDSIEKTFIIVNGTSGAFTVQVKTVSGTGVIFGVSEKSTKLLFSDGTNIVDAGFSGALDIEGRELVLDADGDTSLTADTDDQIDIKIGGTDQLTIKDGALSPVTTNDIDLGTASLEFKNAFFDGTVTSDAFAGPLTGNVTGNASGTAATVTTAAQSNITSLGTLTTLTVDNVITNGSTIGHTSDTDLITLADGVVTVAGELDATTLDISGNADIDGTLEADAITINGTAIASVLSPIAGGSGIVTTGALDAGSITSGFGAIDNGTSGIRTNTFTAETSFVPDAQDGAALGTTSLQFSDLFLADEAVIGFGDNNEVTLTHVHDTGILLNGTNVIQFNDASQNIGAPSNAILDINATDEIELNSTLIDINANVEISGTATTTGVHTFTAVPLFPNNTIETADIQADAITAAKIADNAVVTAGINADAVTAAKIADNAVVTAGINADAVTGAEIADDAINSEHYTDGSIDHVHLAGDAVDGDNLADNAVDSEHYTDGSIDTVHIGDNQVTLAKMAGGTDGNIISFDASGDPVAIATGSDGQVLTSTGAGSPPAFETPAAGISAGKAIAFAIVFG